uniref:PR domain zinc finger protein 8 n=1 Tax=Varanus komodoensis TaxID=61221 RepID=A0A8D2KYE5_VARKO
MEDPGVHRGLWDGDAKAVQQCLTDIFTSVYTTCDIPENAIFGPCVLSHTSLYDSIAFIALKSTDKRTVPYIFRVDTSAANGSSEGLMWLRLVQSARDKEEQNLEAYIKNGQLFYRSLRRIAKDEELLVWYGKELTELLLLNTARSHSKMNGSPPYTCLECSQRFQFEFPHVAHLRFRCPKRMHGAESSPLENSRAGSGGGSPGGAREQAEDGAQGPHGGSKAKRKFPGGGGGGGGEAAAAAVGADAAPALLHLAVPAGAELVRQVQRLLPHDLRPGVPHALAPQEGVRARAAGQAAARGEAQVPHLQRVLPRAPPPLPAHDLAQLRARRPAPPRPSRESSARPVDSQEDDPEPGEEFRSPPETRTHSPECFAEGSLAVKLISAWWQCVAWLRPKSRGGEQRYGTHRCTHTRQPSPGAALVSARQARTGQSSLSKEGAGGMLERPTRHPRVVLELRCPVPPVLLGERRRRHFRVSLCRVSTFHLTGWLQKTP